MTARIYRPARNAMQSGKAKTRDWILEFEAEAPREIEPLMGYTASTDTKAQVKLRFETKDAAVAYARRNGIAYTVHEPHDSVRRPISYSDNFRFDRKNLWTH
ncbi:ETC complex I subunit [Lutibaculum baratangense]|uniref:NADH-ubiquinone oxidoreductase family protein n=1 Tax=Lutibaculum baratangense AMV1 TaxID=631454 RepID=V4RAX4_9HYPH|nr:ETC complex I subunit [Lutibaculum baratangense]ESR23331.1 NADH-ubiquinone oxidoreductase family protein [Lutibaculum baratangense AMV1]